MTTLIDMINYENESTIYWKLLEEITRKKDWYEKVFDEKIVSKWYQEIIEQGGKKEDIDNFWLCIRILKATAQGTWHNPECSWDGDQKLCDDCFEKVRKEKGVHSSDEDAMDDLNELIHEKYKKCSCSYCNCKGPNSNLSDYVDYMNKNFMSSQHLHNLKQMVHNLMTNYPIDYHPWSNDQVIDIVHPSLYCYVKGVSKHTDGTICLEKTTEETKYQWLPSDILINKSGKVTFASYINNLHDTKYVPLLEKTLTAFIPRLEKVLQKPLKNRLCQVIVKIGSIVLDNSSEEKQIYKGGSWHIEGMPYEHIAATCIYYLDVNNITDSYLEFRKPVVLNEINIDYPQCDSDYTETHYGIEPGSHYDGKMNRYLGLIKAEEGASVVFPNSLQHRVKDFKLKQSVTQDITQDIQNVIHGIVQGVRTIIAFFFIDPDHTILSTNNVPKQYNIMSLEDAKLYREKLMYQRKYFVNTLNQEVYEREYSLCEH